MKWKFNKAYLYLLPSLIIIFLFQLYPLIKAFSMSFYTKFDYIRDIVYSRGLDNFKIVLNDPNFYLALKNTFLFVLLSVPISITVSLFFAVLLNKITRFKKFFTSVYFLPFVTSTVAISMVWKWMFHSEYGLINSVLTWLNMTPQKFLMDPNWTIPMLVILSVWKGLGYKIIIFLAGLQNIDSKYYNAAKIDGASKFQRFKNITLPLLAPTTFFLSVTSIISCFKIFDEIFILYDKTAGPVNSGLTMVYYIFDKFYMHWQFATASAAAFILFIIIFIFTIIQLRIGRRWNYYDK